MLCHDCAPDAQARAHVDGVAAAGGGGPVARLLPWSRAARGARLARTAATLLARHSSEDLLFALFRLAVILEGVLARSKAGNASSDEAAEKGALGIALAERGWELARG